MSPPSRILVCDHRGTGIDRELTALGRPDLVLVTSSSLRESLTRLGEAPPDAIVLDPLSRSGTTELAALEATRAVTGQVIPLLVIVAQDDEEAATRIDRVLETGAWDLVRRGTKIDELALRLERLVELKQLADEMNDLRHQASHDDRTDLLRPKAFQARVLEHFSAAQRHHHDLALVLIDLDRFGAINKEHDHTVGDVLISRVGDAIRRTLRVEDVAGRLGGDEFGVLLPYTGKINAALVVNRLRQEIVRCSGTPEGAKGHVACSASIGFETYDGVDIESVETLRRHAERALRVAKVQGGDQGIYFRSLDE